MAEYYPLLAKAVASLPNSTLDSRKVVYERARKALIGQLRTLHPPVPDEDIDRESEALDGAIARLETELAASAPAPLAAEPPPPPVTASDAPSSRPPDEGAQVRFPSSGGALGPSPSKPFSPLRTKLPPLKPATPPPVAEDAAVALSSTREPPSPVLADAPPSSLNGQSQDRGLAPDRPLRPRPEQQRPFAPQPPEPKRAKRPVWIVPTGIGVVVLLVAFAAYKLRDRPEVLHPRVAEQTPADAGKSVDRVGNSGSSNGEGSRTAASGASAAGQAQQGGGAGQAGNPPAPVAGRAALLMEAPEEKDKVRTFLGTVVWRLDNVSDGQNQAVGLAVRADIDMPDDKMKATVVFQKNVDASLPASHTIKVRFAVQPGSPSGNVQNIDVPQMRSEASSTGEPLNGVTVPIVENSFLVGLSPGNSESANLELVRAREWIDIPIRLSSGKIAKLTFEKTDAGQRDLQEAIAAWSKS